VADARAKAQAAGLDLHVHVVVVPGQVVEAVVGLINERRIDLLAVGFMGHSALYERIIGGTTDRLVRLSPCS
jgi:nucleotide-binding universal stress UspA family protein